MYVALAEAGLNNEEIAAKLHVSEASVRRGLKKAGYQPFLIPSSVITKLRVDLEHPLRINVGKLGAGAATSDWHHPLCDYPLVNQFIGHARDAEATNWLGIFGDWWNMDALSAFDYKQDTAGLAAEAYGSHQTIIRLLETFDRIYFSWGNHDSRFHKTLGYKVPFTKAMQMLFHQLDASELERITFTNLDHVWLDTPLGPYYACHPANYSQVPLTNARKIAMKMQAHTLTAHSHHTAVGYDVSGNFICAELGGFFDGSKVEYLRRSTAFPTWQNGYALLDKAGHLQVEGKGWSTRS